MTPEAIAAAVEDPELPSLTLADLGILRGVSVVDGVVEVAITPTYNGCPAMERIAQDVREALAGAGFPGAQIRVEASPAWSTDQITALGLRRLAAAGIAPPVPRPSGLFTREVVPCPRCGVADTERLAAFGATPCKALWRCRACREPFEAFKCH